MYLLKSNCTALKDGLSYIEYAYSPEGQLDIENTYGVPLTEADLAAGSSKIAELYAGCASASCIKDELTVAGSTTVYPVVVEWAYGYKENCAESNITVDWELGGSTAGAKRVCGDPAYVPVEIGTLSRQMSSKEGAKQADGTSSLS
jgi:ABC-type phosphate transport system substrate-binding protein